MENIFVYLKVRPLSEAEVTVGIPWKLGSNSICLCDSIGAPILGQSYMFDKVFDPESSTLKIYETHIKDIITSAIIGFNGTVFAYGKIASDKTYTMRGSSSKPNIIPLAVQEVFKNIDIIFYMEIFNKEIYDPLASRNQKLQIHDNIKKGTFVLDLKEAMVASFEQVLELMTAAHRHVGVTNMNVHSSRSHLIFHMSLKSIWLVHVIESNERSHDVPAGAASKQSSDVVRMSVLNLVGLASSERIAKIEAKGPQLKEGIHINNSLMALWMVINKLSEGVEKQGSK